MNTSAYADTAVRESPFFYYMYKKNLSFTLTHTVKLNISYFLYSVNKKKFH